MRMGGSRALRRGFGATTILGFLVVMVGCSAFFPNVPTDPPSQAPVASASDGTAADRIVVSWGSVTDAASYKIYRADALDGVYTLRATVEDVTSWEDIGLAVGVHHWYRVEACNVVGCSAQSASDEGYTLAVPPGVPGTVSATDATSADAISVSWGLVAEATSYRIYRADALAGAYELRASSAATPWEDDGLPGGVHHWYRIAACNAGGCSAQSTADEGSTSIAAPTAPAWVIAEDGVHADRIGITWSPVAIAETYDVYRASSYSGEYVLLTSVAGGTSHEDAGLGADTHFWYKVAACNSAGCSALSTTDEGYTSGVVPAVPAQPAATDGLYAYRIDVSWTAVAGATSYNIYRATPPDDVFGYRGSALGGGVSSWMDGDVSPATSYRYRITACNGVGCSDPSPDDAGSTSP